MARTAVVSAAHQNGPLKSPLKQAPPRSRLPHAHARSRMRVRAFNALARRGGAIMRLGITPRPYRTNSLRETHPRHCGGLCDVAGVNPVTPRRLLPYG
jgi:hypothetical protein